MKKKIQKFIDDLELEKKALEDEHLHYVLVMDWKITVAKLQLLTELIQQL